MSKNVNEAHKAQLEAALKSGNPADLYNLIPASQRNAFERFARCFGIGKEEIDKLRAKTRGAD